MRLIGYTRTNLSEDVGAQDLDEQERGLAEYCRENSHDLTHVLADPDQHWLSHPDGALERALKSDADGIVITDPLVIAENVQTVHDFSNKLVKHNKHLLIIYRDAHIDPNEDPHQSLMQICEPLLSPKGS